MANGAIMEARETRQLWAGTPSIGNRMTALIRKSKSRLPREQAGGSVTGLKPYVTSWHPRADGKPQVVSWRYGSLGLRSYTANYTLTAEYADRLHRHLAAINTVIIVDALRAHGRRSTSPAEWPAQGLRGSQQLSSKHENGYKKFYSGSVAPTKTPAQIDRLQGHSGPERRESRTDWSSPGDLAMPSPKTRVDKSRRHSSAGIRMTPD